VTTIAAVARDGQVHMAADSLTNIYDRPIFDGARKIRRIPVGETGQALLGVCGDGGLADLASARLRPSRPDSDLQAWAAGVAYEISSLAVEHGLTEQGRLDGSLLLGFDGRLWHTTHGQAIPIPDGVAAAGSGEGPAMGALDVLLARGEDVGEAVRLAVEIACHRDKHSAGPIYTESLGGTA
jgi:ATP-dependent protease HslVU (ClpYQ) peptidase subunit